VEKIKKSEYRIKKIKEIYGVLCTNCMRVYKANYIKLYCNFDSINYYTKIMEKESEDENIQPATWEKYHCHLIINQQMQCIKCQNNLFLKLKENKLYCPKCQFTSDPTMILWTCITCGQEFTTNAKIYNPYEYKPISIAIKNSIFNKEVAIPEYCPCKGHKTINYTHKKECNGKLFITYLHERKMVICEKCKAMTKYNKFIWCCPTCGVKFRDDGSQNENYHINNDLNSSSKDNSEIISTLGNDNFYDVTIPNKKDEVNHLELYKLKGINNKSKKFNNGNAKLDENKIVDIPIFDKSKYDIISELNEGKKSKVYCVKDDNNKFYAMKVKEIQNEDENEYFEEKYKLQYNLENKFFVKLYSMNIDRKNNELSTLYDLGLNNWQSEINSMKKALKFYNESLLVSIIFQISSGLYDLYVNGFLHLNINPHNIIIFSDSIYKISDCEMSIDFDTLLNDFKGSEHQLTSEEILGILDSGNRYMSPKFKLMIKNRININVDYLDKNDVYSLGLCILSTMSRQKDDKIIINDFVYLSSKLYNELVNDTTNNYMKEKINYYTKNLGYSNKFLNLLYNMMNVNDSKRFSFKQIIDYITKQYNL
jgi:ribosomal protein L37AE/L43A